MAGIILFTAVIASLILVPPVIGIIIYNMGFRHKVMVAKQTGPGAEDVIWVEDSARIGFKNGNYTMTFKRHRGKTQVPEGKWWHRFLRKNAVKEFTEEEWRKKDMRRAMQRGIMLYQNNEGEFHPMRIRYENNRADLEVLSQDNRMFIAQEIQDTQELTLSKRQQVIAIVAIVVGFILIAAVMILGFIYIGNQADNLARVAIQVGTQASQGVVGG